MCNTCGCSAAEEINPVESVVIPAPLGRGVAQFYSEGGDMATYAPSQEPDMESPATEPTNANFEAEDAEEFCVGCKTYVSAYDVVNAKGGDVCFPCWHKKGGEIIDGVAYTQEEASSYFGAEFGNPIDGKFTEMKITISDGSGNSPSWYNTFNVKCVGEEDNLGYLTDDIQAVVEDRVMRWNGDEVKYGAESKSMFGKDKNGRMYARRRNGRIITHNAEHEGVYACSKCKHWNRNPVDGITKCKKCGNGTFTFVKRSEFMPEGDGNVVGQQTFGFNGTPLHAEEDTSFGLVGEGNDFGQMRAEEDDLYYCSKCDEGFSSINPTEEGQFCDSCLPSSATLHDEMESITMDADYALEKPFTTGAKLSAGLLTGAALFGVVGASLTALLGSMTGRGE